MTLEPPHQSSSCLPDGTCAPATNRQLRTTSAVTTALSPTSISRPCHFSKHIFRPYTAPEPLPRGMAFMSQHSSNCPHRFSYGIRIGLYSSLWCVPEGSTSVHGFLAESCVYPRYPCPLLSLPFLFQPSQPNLHHKAVLSRYALVYSRASISSDALTREGCCRRRLRNIILVHSWLHLSFHFLLITFGLFCLLGRGLAGL